MPDVINQHVGGVPVEEALSHWHERISNFQYEGYRIPPRMISGLADYIVLKRPPGGFLEAVLRNDLRMAAEHADEQNKPLLWVYVALLYNVVPVGSWGSSENYERWLVS